MILIESAKNKNEFPDSPGRGVTQSREAKVRYARQKGKQDGDYFEAIDISRKKVSTCQQVQLQGSLRLSSIKWLHLLFVASTRN